MESTNHDATQKTRNSDHRAGTDSMDVGSDGTGGCTYCPCAQAVARCRRAGARRATDWSSAEQYPARFEHRRQLRVNSQDCDSRDESRWNWCNPDTESDDANQAQP